MVPLCTEPREFSFLGLPLHDGLPTREDQMGKAREKINGEKLAP